ncbi:sugar ABC transporter permease [Paenibacillus pasadenensis]|uniref:carbohydrate ABC transporter permease n=1 Tax=Paenibacillus pasadenensis TaxID=217090 RepID=UPI00203C4E0D|nr:sugar ABC transporter permease [Paenibacillus pasadenensis]MCM3745765.1 sugar ABC transporter permease [Paenibacillus pasadenensis]
MSRAVNTASQTDRTYSRLLKRETQKKLWAYVFILPQTIMFMAFVAYPIVMSYVYSMYEWNGIGPRENFVGLKYYGELMSDHIFWNAYKNSFLFMLTTVVTQLPAALLLALVLNSPKLRLKVLYRTTYFLPVVTSSAVVAAVMRYIFGQRNGVFNEALMMLNLIEKPVPWLSSMDYALFTIALISSWKWLGIKLVYFLAGLQSIPNEVYEAAMIDGANRRQTLWYITIPLIMPVGAVILMLSVVDGLHAFDLVKVMTDGGPGIATQTVDLYIYTTAFAGIPSIGYASAAGIFFGLSIFAVSLLLGWIVKTANAKGGK